MEEVVQDTFMLGGFTGFMLCLLIGGVIALVAALIEDKYLDDEMEEDEDEDEI